MNKLLLLLSLALFSQAGVVFAAEQIYFFHNDHLGTPQELTDMDQNVVWRAGKDPFGDAAPLVEVVENNLRFPGQYYDEESGFHYNWNRYYDPGTGRYITSDPIGLVGGVNTFSYGYSNPTKNVDRTGLLIDPDAVFEMTVKCPKAPAGYVFKYEESYFDTQERCFTGLDVENGEYIRECWTRPIFGFSCQADCYYEETSGCVKEVIHLPGQCTLSIKG